MSHLNVRSLVKHFQDFKQLVYNKFDIIAVSETWLTADIPDDIITLNGYYLLRRDRGDRKGGGIAVYIKHYLKVKIINNLQPHNSEQLWLSISLNNYTYAFGILYRPPKFPANQFLSELENSLGIISPKYDHLICTGDININCLDTSDNLVQTFDNILNCFGLKQIVEEPTRYSPTSCKIIDIICCSEDIKINNVSVSSLSTTFTDHCLVSCIIGNEKYKVKPFLYTYRDFKHFNYSSFTDDLHLTDFNQIYYLNDINDKVACFNRLLLDLFELHAPIKTVIIRKRKAPWITENIREMMSLRDKALAKYKKSKLLRDWNSYKDLKNQTNYAITREKKAYLEYSLNNDRGNRKGIWKHLKDMDIHFKQKSRTVPHHLSNVEKINDYFISSSISNEAPDIDTLNYYSNNTREGVGQFNFKHTNDLEIYKAILSFRSKAVGVDKISISMLLYACPHILPFICHLFNFAIDSGTYPSIWKKSHVIPLPKLANPEELKDLRPISILCAISKVFEKIIHNQMREHLNEFNVLPSHQSGFRPGHSCSTALLKVTDDILTSIDLNNLSIIVLLDYTKAFDRIRHLLLLAILHYIGFTDTAVALLRNYVHQRFQAVVLGKETSKFKLLENGVPQGSILGPLMFTIYTLEFYKHLQFSSFHFYADDTQIYISFPENDLPRACNNLNSDLASLVTISTKFCLSINPQKSKIILFGRDSVRKRCSDRICIQVNNNTLPLSMCEKNLGLLLDNRLRYSEHITMITKRAFCNLKMIYGVKHFLNKKCKILLCNSLVLSHFNYADTVYGFGLLKTDCHRVQLIQNSCVRLICNLRKRDHITQYLKEIGWLNMERRRILHSCVFYHKLITCQTPEYLYHKITFRNAVHSLNVRSRNLLTIPQHRTVMFQSSFSYRVAKLYNLIPSDLKGLPINLFRKKLKKILFTNDIKFC